jgi:hypothetical protein
MSTPRRLDTVTNHGAVVLRSSCDACTDVKMACSRGKPTCARCARRGEVCIYGPMKRAGRKKQQHDPSQLQPQPQPQRQPQRKTSGGSRQRSNSTRVHLPSPSSSMTIRNPSESLPSHQSLSLDLFMHHSEESSNSYAFTLPLSPEEPEIDPAQRPELRNPNDGQPKEASLIGAEDGNININASSDMDIGIFTPPGVSLGTFDESDWMLLSPDFPQLGLNTYSPPHTSGALGGPVSILESNHTLPEIPQSEGCLELALNVLGTLTTPRDVCPSTTGNEDNKNRQDSAGIDQGISKSAASNGFEDVMRRNLASIDSISPILKCTCATDSGVALILAPIIFQILSWYAAAAGVPCEASFPLGQVSQLPRVPRPVASSMPGYHLNEEGTQDRIVCQTVLSKMHTVRTLVESLSQILLCNGNRTNHNRFHGHDMEGLLSFDKGPPSALAITLDDELRRCLRDVSRAIVAKLAEV